MSDPPSRSERPDAAPAPVEHAEVQRLERPHPHLLKYYVLQSLLLGPFFPLALIPLFFRYHTLRYRFDEQGISMRWGILFRREISLNYARIQDIHLASNIVERWFGLGRVQVQTASGSAAAEMTIEGLREFESVRDYLYSRMRGARRLRVARPSRPAASAGAEDAEDAVATALREVAVELAAVRRALEARGGPAPPARDAT
ncbi:MAG TPA: PH domain-containing protein [Thermoanaerobaculia bacterium]|nr:PH domain-containing protein [Thermoanaerobaculia bacterium]